MVEVVRRLSLLNEAAKAMTSIMDPERLLDRILDLTREVFGFDACAVLLLDRESNELIIHRARGYDQSVVSSFRGTPGAGITGRALLSTEPVLETQLGQADGYVQGVPGAVAEVAVPLRLDDRAIGVLDAESTTAMAFTKEDMALLLSFASHAAAALHNARLHQRLGRQRERLEHQLTVQRILAQASEVMLSTLDCDEVLSEILSLAKQALHLQTCAVLLLDPDGSQLILRAADGYREDWRQVRIALGEGVTGRAAATGLPVLVSDVRLEPGYIEGVSEGRTELAIPLTVRDRIIGVLDVEAREPHAFTEQDVETVSVFAHYAAVALRNAVQMERIADQKRSLEQANTALATHVSEIERMNVELTDYAATIRRTNEDLEHRVKELAALYQASQTITSSLDLNQTLQSIVDMTRAIINASSGAIRLLDDEFHDNRPRQAVRSGQEPTVDADRSARLIQTPLKIGQRTIGFFELGRAHGDFSAEERRMLETLASQAAIAIENARLFERTQRTYYQTIRALAEALEARDAYTRGHSERVTQYALRIADAMGLSESNRRMIEHAGLLHDIGKIGISDSILLQTTPLSPEDRATIQSHPLFGDQILGPIQFLHDVQEVVRHHHERYDGGGYPDGLTADEIPLSARIVCVADAFDAMTSDRPYRAALSREHAVEELERERGRQFDPAVVDAFLGLLSP